MLPRLGRLTQGWAARRREALAGTRSPPPAARGRRRFLRRPRVAQRRRPAADPLAKFRAGGQARRPPIRAAAQPRRGRRARPLAARAPLARTGRKRGTGRQLRRHGVGRPVPQGRKQHYLGISNGKPECMGGPASSATLQRLMEQLALIEARPDTSLPALLGGDVAASHGRHRSRAGQHPRGRSDRCGAVRGDTVRSGDARSRAADSLRQHVERTVGGVFLP